MTGAASIPGTITRFGSPKARTANVPTLRRSDDCGLRGCGPARPRRLSATAGSAPVRNSKKRSHASGLDRGAPNAKPGLDMPGRNCRSIGTQLKSARVADERNSPDAERRRKHWKRFQAKADPRRLVFIDETWMKISMSPRHGWSPQGAKGVRISPLQPSVRLDIRRRSAARPDRRPLGSGRADRRRRLPNPRRNAAGSDARPRRHRRHGQPRQPQDRSGARGDQRRRCLPAVPPALQSRPRPDRAGVRQARAFLAEGPSANPRRSLEDRRRNPEKIQARRMREPSRELRICRGATWVKTALIMLGAACSLLQDWPEPLEIRRHRQHLQRIALGRYLLQTILGVPETWLLRHHDL